MQENDAPAAPAYGTPLAPDLHKNNALANADEIALRQAQYRVHRAGNWFFWIAVLSLVNSVFSHAGGNFHFILGLGYTEVVDAVAHEFGGGGTAVAIVFDLFAASVFALFGLMARRMAMWPFVVGMALYALDGALLLLLKDFLSAAFHAYVLYHLWTGVSALREARAASR